MKKDLFDKYKKIQQQEKSKLTNERQAIIKMFTDRLNQGNALYKSLQPAFISMKMAYAGLASNAELMEFYQECDRAKHFSKYWWWALTAKEK